MASKNFTVTRKLPIDELQCLLTEVTHTPTGAQILHLANDDPENVFCLSLRTYPSSSSGAPHILEHTVLCGSEKFPVKDPFFAMNRRSLNTFMNAMTGPDFTCYPAASQVPTDFYNLLEVYLDAVFFPKILKMSFLQEGHRLGFTNEGDPTSPLLYKGIVFNEMKGALASPDSRLANALHKALLPDLTYSFNSGGDPKVIPELTYKELCDFHKTYYAPSQCLFFFYGNLPLDGHLDFIERHVLSRASEKVPIPSIPLQCRFQAPKKIEEPYPAKEGDQPIIACSWLTSPIQDQATCLALNVIEIALMDTDASPLKKALLQSGLCHQVSAYVDNEMTEIPFVIQLKGCKEKDAAKIETLIETTLKKIVEVGLPHNLIENALHQLEFHRSEIVGDHHPFGLALFFRSGLLKQQGVLPEKGLQIHTLFDELREAFRQDPSYFDTLIDTYLIENPHRVQVVLTPDADLTNKEQEEEKVRLADLKDQLSKEDAATIVQQEEALARFQKEQEDEDIDVLPKVTLKDVPPTARDYPLILSSQGDLDIFYHDCFTNEIVYADLLFDLPPLEEKDLFWIRLLTTLMTQLGCGGRAYDENLDYMQAHTGGMSACLTFNIQVVDHHRIRPAIGVRGKALHKKAGKLFPLMKDIVMGIDVSDRARLKEVLLQQYTAMESHFVAHAMKYAIKLSMARLGGVSRLAQAWSGLEYFIQLRDLVSNIDQRLDEIVEKLVSYQDKLLCRGKPHLVVTCANKMMETLQKEEFYGLSTLACKPGESWKETLKPLKISSQGHLIPAPVGFTGRAMATVSYVHEDAPALGVASYLCNNTVLHREIREKGGAYGGGAAHIPLSGNFYFYAYRDPNITSSLKAFEKSLKEVCEGNFSGDQLEEAQLEVVQGLDHPISPGARGDLAYCWHREGKTLERRQTYRDRLLSLSREKVMQAVKEHLLAPYPESALVTFAGQEILDEAKKALPDFVVQKI